MQQRPNRPKGILILSIWLVLTLALAPWNPCQAESWSDDDAVSIPEGVTSGGSLFPIRILFIGNSYTAAQGGLEIHVRNLALSANPSAEVITQSVTRGGYTLQSHWSDQQTIATIHSTNWNFIILQEQSTRPVDNPGLMRQYARLLDSAIHMARSRTGLFMTWARANDPEMIEDLAKAYDRVGEELEALVVPVGRAWEDSLAQWPELRLHVADNSHPNAHGTYLAACVFYASIWRQSPEGLAYVSSREITEEEKLFLQRVAWDTVQQYVTEPGSLPPQGSLPMREAFELPCSPTPGETTWEKP
jgi:hypothetical protein